MYTRFLFDLGIPFLEIYLQEMIQNQEIKIFIE